MSEISGGERLRLPDFVLEEAKVAMHVQDLIMDLTEDEIAATTDYFLATVVLENVESFVSNLLLGVEYRPGNTELYVSLLKEFVDTHTQDDVVEKTKKTLLEKFFSFCFIPLLYPQPLRYSHFAFLCYKEGIFTEAEILSGMKFYTLGTHLDQMAINISWFGPEICKSNPRFYVDHSDITLKRCFSIVMPTIYSDSELNFSDFEANQWEVLKAYRELGCNPSPLCQAIAKDDFQELKKLLSDRQIDLDTHVPPSVFEPFWILNCCPTLIQYAAARGSVMCFRYLLLSGAKLNKRDQRGRTIEQFAIFGGNLEIIRLIEDHEFAFTNCLRWCILYHRNCVGEWIEQTMCVSDEERASILANAVISNNVSAALDGLRRGNNVNAKDSRSEYPITQTIINGSYSCFNLLFAHPDIDLTVSGMYGSPLQTAVRFGRASMVSKLMLYSCEPVDGVTLTQMSYIHMAVEQNFSGVIDALIQQPNVDVNVMDPELGTPLQLAILLGNVEAAAALLRSPTINLTVRTVDNLTPILLAVSLSDVKMVSLLLSDPRSDVYGPNATTNFLFYAVVNGLAAMVKLLLGRPELDLNEVHRVCFIFIMFLSSLQNRSYYCNRTGLGANRQAASC